MITITGYKLTKRNNSTKQPTGGLDVNVVLKEGTTVHGPSFLLSSIYLNDFNYIKWDNRYYYVVEKVQERNDLVRFNCSMDYLATYKTQILNTVSKVIYSENNYDRYLTDSRIPSTDVIIRSDSSQTIDNRYNRWTIEYTSAIDGTTSIVLTDSEYNKLISKLADPSLYASLFNISEMVQGFSLIPFIQDNEPEGTITETTYDSCLPNCVGYAWGRWREALGANPKLSKGNASGWYSYTSDGYARGSTPKNGAVACWSGGTDSSGHVAIIENVTTLDGVTYVSITDSAYNDTWTMADGLTGKNRWRLFNISDNQTSSTMYQLNTNGSITKSGYTFLGYIYYPSNNWNIRVIAPSLTDLNYIKTTTGGYNQCIKVVTYTVDSTVSTELRQLYLGKYATGCYGYSPKVYNSNTYTIDIPWNYDDFRNRSPYSYMQIFLPYYGYVKLSTDEFINQKTLQVKFIYNCRTGDVIYIIDNRYRYTANAAMSVRVATSRGFQPIIAGALNATSTLVNTAVQANGDMVSGGFNAGLSLVGGIMQWMGDSGSVGSNSNGLDTLAGDNITVSIFTHAIEYEPSESLHGRPCNKNLLLSECTGYTQTYDASVSTDDTVATSHINAQLNGGVYIE